MITSMYYVYVFGCNKYKPCLLFAGKDLKSLQERLVKIVFGTGHHNFLDLIDGEKMKKEHLNLGGEEDKDVIEKIILDGGISGPGKDYSWDYCNLEGYDWYITEGAYKALYSRGGVEARCMCSRRLSIFHIQQDATDFKDVIEAIRWFIL